MHTESDDAGGEHVGDGDGDGLGRPAGADLYLDEGLGPGDGDVRDIDGGDEHGDVQRNGDVRAAHDGEQHRRKYDGRN